MLTRPSDKNFREVPVGQDAASSKAYSIVFDHGRTLANEPAAARVTVR
jgi:hypothetical protein